MRSHCAAPHGCSVTSAAARARTSAVGRISRAGEDRHRRALDRRTLIGDRELGQAIDLVAPEIDAHRMIGGDRIDVDDRAPHRDLAAPSTWYSRRYPSSTSRATNSSRSSRPPGATVTGSTSATCGPSRCTSARIGATTTNGSRASDAAIVRSRQSTHAAAHRLERGRHPLERQRLPRGELLDRVGAEELAQVVGDALGLGRGRHRDDDRPARGRPRQRGEEQRARGVADRDRFALPAARAHRGLVGEQHGDAGERRRRSGQTASVHVPRVL